jgi:hypothetical protein
MSNLGFELWWAGGTTTLLTTQPQVGSRYDQVTLFVVKKNNAGDIKNLTCQVKKKALLPPPIYQVQFTYVVKNLIKMYYNINLFTRKTVADHTNFEPSGFCGQQYYVVILNGHALLRHFLPIIFQFEQNIAQVAKIGSWSAHMSSH